ncbi:MAG: hypothetical protein JXA54_06775 [Candidatus Heimdallarchaeota archaeon]|nr:hypothetical protein [Candidatus Heimdallarchaeota archaeon]
MKEIIFSTITVEPDRILLDPKNPRFLSKDIIKCQENEIQTDKVQNQIKKIILNDYQGKLIKESIRNVGFLKIDRVVCKTINIKEKEYYLLIEGNRRIAAVKDLLEDVKNLKVELPPFIMQSLKNIEIFILDNASYDNIWLIQGLRHISGISDWKAFEKSQAMKNLYLSNNHNTRVVGEIIGRNQKEIADYLRALVIYEEAKKDQDYGEIVQPNKWDFFIHLAQATEWTKWLGFVEGKTNLLESKIKNYDNLKRFLSWLAVPNYSIKDLDKIPEDEEDKDKPILSAGRELREVKKLLKHGEKALDDFEQEGIYPALEKHGEVTQKIVWPSKIKAAIKALEEMGIVDIKKAAKEKDQQSLLAELQVIVNERIEDIKKYNE